MAYRSPLFAWFALSLVLVSSCGGSDQPASWSEPVEVTSSEGRLYMGAVKVDPAGGINFALSALPPQGDAGPFRWTVYRRAPSAASWSAAVTMPDPFGCCVQWWSVDAQGLDSVVSADPNKAGLWEVRRGQGGWLAPAYAAALSPAGLSLRRGAYAGAGLDRIALYQLPDGSDWLGAVRYDPGFGWSVHELGTGPIDSLEPIGFAAGPLGTAMAVWRESVPTPRVMSRYYSPATGWSAAQAIEGTGNGMEPSSGSLAAAGHGSFFLGHLSCVDAGKSCVPMVSRYDPATGWSTLMGLRSRLSDTLRPMDGVRVFAGTGGHAIALWGELHPRAAQAQSFPVASLPIPRYYDPKSSYYTPGKGWSTPVDAPFGDKVVVDTTGRVSLSSGYTANRFEPASGWRDLPPPPQRGLADLEFGFVAEPSGAITAIWTERTSPTSLRVVSSRYP